MTDASRVRNVLMSAERLRCPATDTETHKRTKGVLCMFVLVLVIIDEILVVFMYVPFIMNEVLVVY